jgi:type IV pilus assembly protein PilM
VDKSGGKFRPVKAVKQNIHQSVNQYENDGPKRSVAVPALSEAFKKLGITPRKVKNLYSSIGAAQVSAKEISAIHMDDEEMASAMLLESRKHLPLDGSQSVMDFQILGDDTKEGDKVRVLITATTKKHFDAHTEMLRDLELKPGVIDIDQLAAINSYVIGREIPEEGALIFLNVGARKTNLTVFGRKDMFFTREIPIAGHVFNEELAKKYGLSLEEAEKVKIAQGMNPDLEISAGDSAGKVIRMAEKSAVDRLGDEINRSLRYYVKESGQSYFTKMIITGGSAPLKGFDESMQERFNVPVEVFNPFKSYNFTGEGIAGPQFAVAFGLAMRGD